MRIEDMLVRDIKYEKFKRNDPIRSLMSAKRYNKYKLKKYDREYDKFEREVFLHLFENKDKLDIEKIYKLKNMRVDAALKLNSGKTILLEIKYALNWRNCCNARVEVQRFMGEKFYEHIPEKRPERALIVFGKFCGGWEAIRRAQNHKYESGWSYFYEEEEILRKKPSTMPIDIAQLTGEGLKGAPF